ncbi:MAG: GTP-binding protein [Chitinophagales bacterium]|nr:GTP-binding protein [Chitinophagales bacterium]
MTEFLSKKVILAGPLAVGKTSLVQKFVYNKFSEKYISTIGVRIEKKVIDMDSHKLNLIIWDLAGESTQKKSPQSYFLGTNGIIYVVDISRPPTFLNIQAEIDYLKQKVPNAPIIVIGNKADLFKKEELEETVSIIPVKPDFVTSAKTGDLVNEMFEELASRILDLQTS